MFRLLFVFIAAVGCTNAQVNYLKSDKRLTAATVRQLASAKNDVVHFNTTLHTICVPRVVGSVGHEKVKDFLATELRSLGFTVQLDSFATRVPIVGQVRFTNVIGRLNPDADRFLTLACHYDSKYFADFEFLGAIDSAVPCAMMLNVARTLQTELAAKKSDDVSLMLVFFDGEEAFDTWSDTDSLYGSRHLATRLTDIDRIDALLLLDLLGAPNPTFYSYFGQTVPLYQRMVEIERELFKAGQMHGNRYMFRPKRSSASIADDHLPFVAENVPVVHLISNPFPPQWHKVEDDLQHLDAGSMSNFIKILRCFTYEYLTASQPTSNFRVFGRR